MSAALVLMLAAGFLAGWAVREMQMAKYRKRPVVIDAVKWTGKVACLQGLPPSPDAAGDWPYVGIQDSKLIIKTLEGDMTTQIGDWIIKGVQNEIYPVKPDIFEAIYEPVE